MNTDGKPQFQLGSSGLSGWAGTLARRPVLGPTLNTIPKELRAGGRCGFRPFSGDRAEPSAESEQTVGGGLLARTGRGPFGRWPLARLSVPLGYDQRNKSMPAIAPSSAPIMTIRRAVSRIWRSRSSASRLRRGPSCGCMGSGSEASQLPQLSSGSAFRSVLFWAGFAGRFRRVLGMGFGGSRSAK
jgi:hypothetical protein